MAMSAGGSAGGVTSDINVTPMIDVLLVLLIIFMIIQPLNRQTIPIQVPPPQNTAVASGPSNQIVLELRDDGSYAINGQDVPKDQLDTQIHAIYSDVIEAMDVARGAGVLVIGFTPADVVKPS